MPFIHVKIAGASLEPAQTRRLQQGVTTLMATVLRKKAEVTSVLVEELPAAGWSIGGAPVALAAHIDANVTLGTNTAAEKAQFIAEAHALLREVLGEKLPLATYVIVAEVPADGWGYGGLSQAGRAAARLPGA